ncbi:hypothetical protein BK049_02605 [Bacillus xiamenensis]|uniref:Uncharacterized protein n=1 Tax=Bacillus xiamenensis TaxID=1178537 RepID=A0AAC9IFZ3_9BACI|nr:MULTISPECIES: hypothetical protein [Bacillus]AOZ87689.1 hypothetical protein BK049_02605 [Bacillus xiamenensis]EKF37127.1 hypothetical protein BA1_02250 [Bacillus xiamenensis]MBG9910533.1 hypothetical protein [Bacillus xiamenensis]MCW1836711.1 hypothetical protein [Bacillus xiamenensis]MCY9575977.1 hypothetical protein [Bacillus xiamenensis]
MAQKDIFSAMMFGQPLEKEKNKSESKEERKDSSSSDDSIDYMHVMNQIGNIMNSIDELKPVFKDVGPMISAFKKKLS